MASFQNRIRIWKDTKEQSHKYFSTPKQSIQHDYTNLPEPYLNRKFNTTQVYIWKMNPIDATWYGMEKLGFSFPVMLNIANPYSHGNSIELGGAGMEENLFRRSNYFLTFNSNFFPIDEKSCIYSPEITVFRDGETVSPDDYNKTVDELYNLKAENPENTNFKVPVEKDEFYKLIEIPRPVSIIASIKEIELLFRVAANYGHDSLILHANGTSNIETFRKWMEYYNGVFKYVVFAIENEPVFQSFSNEFSKPLKQFIEPQTHVETNDFQSETQPENLQKTKNPNPKKQRKKIRYRLKQKT